MDFFSQRFRHIHLDFHTGEDIPGIGAAFDPDEFADTLAEARVNAICCFARCHHGWLYYDSKKFPERIHPHLERKNLLEQQIEACHERDIRVPIYITVQWDHYVVQRHPDWVALTANGCLAGTPPFEPGFYTRLAVNSPYIDYLKAQTGEVMDMMPVDGFFFDIVQPLDDSSFYSRQQMRERGLDPADPSQRQQFGVAVINEFKQDMAAFVRAKHPEASVFFNAGHVGPRERPVAGAYSHWELESLPSGHWGYVHFPMTQRYARTLAGKDCLGMTGKFHTTWGDFQSLKNQAALEFECFRMLALGAKVGVGDQLHPSGKLCKATYGLIGNVYKQVEAKEPWCEGAKTVSEVGVLSAEAFQDASSHQLLPENMGATRIFEESAYQFDFIDEHAEFGAYQVLVLPDSIPVNADLNRKLSDFVANGGGIIATYRSGLAPDGASFALRDLGVEFKGDAPWSPDFLAPRGPLGEGLADAEHVMYHQGLEVEATAGADVLAEVNKPYFNRTWEHFCSHRHTPSEGVAAYPGVVRNGNCIYFMHPLFTGYQKTAPRWYKALVLNAMHVLLPEPLVRWEAPSAARVMLNHQEAEKRLVLHMLHYVPERKCESFDIIEDIVPLHHVPVSVRVDQTVASVELVPAREKLDFIVKGGRVSFTVPKVEGHQMVALNFAD